MVVEQNMHVGMNTLMCARNVTKFLYVLFMQSLIPRENIHAAVSRTVQSHGYCPNLMVIVSSTPFPLNHALVMLPVPHHINFSSNLLR